jgi:enoyl-CoA hydratase
LKTHVDLQLDGDIGRIVVRPDPNTKPPALDQDTLAELALAVTRIEERANELRGVVLSSASEKHFLVGANIKALSELNAATIAEWVRNGHRIFNRLESLPLPIIAMVNGNALGGGLELAMACDFILAGPNARFGLPEPRLGLLTGWGGAWRLSRRIGRGAAREMLYTGKTINPDQALKIGLCDVHGSVDELDAWIGNFVALVQELSPGSIAETKAMLLAFDEPMRSQSCNLEAAASERLMASPETGNRLKAFFEQRKRAL